MQRRRLPDAMLLVKAAVLAAVLGQFLGPSLANRPAGAHPGHAYFEQPCCGRSHLRHHKDLILLAVGVIRYCHFHVELDSFSIDKLGDVRYYFGRIEISEPYIDKVRDIGPEVVLARALRSSCGLTPQKQLRFKKVNIKRKSDSQRILELN
ncbi:hypothetical protein WN55_00106 [Dufourea novaeangliae]|uniref:NTR domain-containing protein n=1 Tax=Dufourea novaeangliae TaxID=178035 RepID=A0A154NW80_DUFNO|nr:hypothetical protein WN55_00106 [Dufourea novaeangliae]